MGTVQCPYLTHNKGKRSRMHFDRENGTLGEREKRKSVACMPSFLCGCKAMRHEELYMYG